MKPEQREEIEKACKDLEFYDGQKFLPRCCEEDVRMLVKFARQQLNLQHTALCDIEDELPEGKERSNSPLTFSPPVCIEFPAEDEWYLSFGGSNPEHAEQIFSLSKVKCWGIKRAFDGAIRTVLSHPDIANRCGLRVDGEKLWGLIVENNCWDSIKPSPEQLEALVLECLTTTPEEKE